MSKQARTRSRELRQAREQARRRKKRLRLIAGAGGFVIVGLVIAIVVVVVSAATRGGSPRAGGASPGATVAAPAHATKDGAITVGQPGAPVTLTVYLDYMCPYCGRFERANGGEIIRLVQSGKVKVELHPLSFLDRQSGDAKYSTRAANAMATVADRAPDAVLAFNKALYEQQPAEGSTGLTDDQIASVATGAGVAQEVVNGFAGRTFEGWVAASTDAAFKSGITGTPTVKINGTAYTGDLYTVGPLTRAIEAAGAK